MEKDAIMWLRTIGKVMTKELYLEQHPNKIWKGSNGKWYTYIGSGKERRLVKRASKSDLEDYIWESYRVDAENPTLGWIVQKWLEGKILMEEITKGTYDRYFADVQRFIVPEEIYKKRIKDITEDDLDIFLRKVVHEHQLTAKAYSGLRTLILGAFKFAKRWKYTDLSIGAFFKDFDISSKAFRRPEKHPETDVFHEDEIQKLLLYLYAHPTIEHLGLIFAFQTGVRRGELVAIKFEDIHNDILHVRRQEVMYKSDTPGRQEHIVVEYTKTEAGDRYIYLPEKALGILMQIRWMNRDCDYLMGKNGKRINKTSFDHIVRDACTAAGIPPRSMHKIRRTYGTTLIDNGVEDSLIMSQMGHSNISTTRKYYYYANKEESKKKDQINKAIIF